MEQKTIPRRGPVPTNLPGGSMKLNSQERTPVLDARKIIQGKGRMQDRVLSGKQI